MFHLRFRLRLRDNGNIQAVLYKQHLLLFQNHYLVHGLQHGIKFFQHKLLTRGPELIFQPIVDLSLDLLLLNQGVFRDLIKSAGLCSPERGNKRYCMKN